MATKIEMVTSMGTMQIELDEEKAPVTVENFVGYANDGFFDGTIFHRVINGFMIQCGGMNPDLSQKENKAPIVNEANNGLKNDKGTLAMARTNDPNSATSQFFINHADNAFLNCAGPSNPGYAVFGKVTDGMDIVEAIANVKTGRSGMYDDVPTETVTIESVKVV